MNGSDLYFIRDTESGNIKIGRAKDVRKRLAALQTGASARLEVMAAYAGAGYYEQAMHQLFHADRLEGEWFAPKNIRRVLNEMGDGDFTDVIREYELESADRGLSLGEMKRLTKEATQPQSVLAKERSDRIREKLRLLLEDKGLPFLESILDDPSADPALKMRATVILDRYTTPVVETVKPPKGWIAELWRTRHDVA